MKFLGPRMSFLRLGGTRRRLSDQSCRLGVGLAPARRRSWPGSQSLGVTFRLLSSLSQMNWLSRTYMIIQAYKLANADKLKLINFRGCKSYPMVIPHSPQIGVQGTATSGWLCPDQCGLRQAPGTSLPLASHTGLRPGFWQRHTRRSVEVEYSPQRCPHPYPQIRDHVRLRGKGDSVC